MLDVISLKTPQRKWASSLLEGRTSWIFSSCGRCSRLTKETSRTRSGGLRNGQSPCELLRGLSGFLSRQCRGLRPCVESVPEPEDFSPVLTWNLVYFWSLPRAVSPCLEFGHARALSSRVVAAVSRFPSRGSRDLWLSLEAFPRSFPTRLSHRALLRATVVCFDPRLESRGSAGKTGFPGMDRDIWGTLGMLARPWSSSCLSCGERLLLRCDGNAGNSFPSTQG